MVESEQGVSRFSLFHAGFRPYPPLAIHVLQNQFPYTKVDETILAMKAIIKLQSSWEPGDSHPNYKVDIGTLEHIMAAAARKGSFELNIFVWDLIDLLGYEPTECMYENTLQGFSMGVRQDHNMFAVLGEMEDRGFTPSRALIRSLSKSLRYVLNGVCIMMVAVRILPHPLLSQLFSATCGPRVQFAHITKDGRDQNHSVIAQRATICCC